MAKTGFTIDTKDFDVKFSDVVNKKIPDLSAKGYFQMGAQVIRDAITKEPQVPKSRGITKERGRRGGAPGHLRRSQKVERPIITGGEISVEVGFDTPYAAYVHEMPLETHWSTPGTGPKYLESKLIKYKENYIKFVADFIKDRAK